MNLKSAVLKGLLGIVAGGAVSWILLAVSGSLFPKMPETAAWFGLIPWILIVIAFIAWGAREKAAPIYTEGEVVYKASVGRQILGWLGIIVVWILAGLIAMSLYGTVSYGYTISYSNVQPTPNSTPVVLFLGQAPYEWRVPLTPAEKNTDTEEATSAVAISAILTILIVIYTRIKEKWIYQNGRLTIDPQYYLRSTALIGSGFLFVIGILALALKILKIGPPAMLANLDYGTIILVLAGAIFYFLIYKMNGKMLKIFFIITGALVAFSILIELIVFHVFNISAFVTDLTFYALIYYHIFKRIKPAAEKL
jgi:hypothetical protein